MSANRNPETIKTESVLAGILVNRRKNWNGRGKYKEPAAPHTADLPPLPEGWTWASVDQLAAETMIGLDRGRAQQSDDPSLGVPYIKMSNVGMEGRVVYDDMAYVPADKEESARFAVQDGDILFNTRNSKELVGKVGIVRNPPGGAIYNNNLMRIRVPDGVVPAFMCLQMCSHDFRRRMELVKKATTNVAAVYAKDLLPLAIALPPLAEQMRIVAEIEKQFTRLEAGMAALRRVQANLKRYRTAVLKAACEGRLVPTEAEIVAAASRCSSATKQSRHGSATFETGEQLLKRILTERRQNWQGRGKYKEPAEPDAKLHQETPEGWAACSVGQVSECLDGKRVPINKAERAKRHGDVPYYGANGQVGWIDDYLFDEPLVLVVEDETFTGRTQAFSYVIRGKSWVNNHAHVLRATAAVSTAYLNYSLAHYPFTARTTGSTGRRKLTQKALMAAPYLLPPLAEQTRIVAEVERRLSVVEELESVVSANLQRASRLRQSILQKAFTGQL